MVDQFPVAENIPMPNDMIKHATVTPVELIETTIHEELPQDNLITPTVIPFQKSTAHSSPLAEIHYAEDCIVPETAEICPSSLDWIIPEIDKTCPTFPRKKSRRSCCQGRKKHTKKATQQIRIGELTSEMSIFPDF